MKPFKQQTNSNENLEIPIILVDNNKLSPKDTLNSSTITNLDTYNGNGDKLRRSASPLSFLTSLSPKIRKKNKKLIPNEIDLNNNDNDLLPNQLLKTKISNDEQPIIINNINQLPHRLIIKIINYIITDKFDKNKLEFRKSKLPIVDDKLKNNNITSNKVKNSNDNDLVDNDDIFNKNNNQDLENISLVCKLWALEISPQVFSYFIVRSPKHVKSLIRLVSVGLLPGGKRFEIQYVSMIIDRSSNYQKFMNIIKHRMPDKLPDKFLRATTKPILSNLFSKNLFAAFFENCTEVKYLRFYQRWISPDNFSFIGQSLKTNTSIQHLSFRNSNLEDGFLSDLISSLYDNQTISFLDLSGNKLGYETALGLAGVLTRNKSLETIDLFYNNINSSGGIALAKSLKLNNTLKNLYLRWNRIKTPGALAMAEALLNNNTIEIISMDRIEDSGGEALFQSLLSNSSVRNIDLSDCVFQQKTLASLSITLGSLDSSKSVITMLNLKSNQLGNGNLIDLSLALSRNKTITKLNLSDNRISDEQGYLLADSLSSNKSIQSLLLSLNNLSDKFSLHLSNSLRVNETLILLDISANQITSKGGKLIAESLIYNNNLKLLNINQNPLSFEFGTVISECLKQNHAIEHLELAYTGLQSKGALPIIKSLARDEIKLKKLNLSENSLSDQVGIEFANALSTNTILTDLDLSLNNLSYKSKEQFEILKSKNKTLLNYSISSIPLKWKFHISSSK